MDNVSRKIITNSGFWNLNFLVALCVFSSTTITRGISLNMYGNLVLPLREFYDTDKSQTQFVLSSYYLGSLMGLLLCPYLLSYLKRIMTMKVAVLVHMVVFPIPVVFSSCTAFILSRLLVGFTGSIIFTISLAIFVETTPDKYRCIVANVCFAFSDLSLMGVSIYLYNAHPLLDKSSFQHVIWITSVLNGVLSLFLFLVEDSPEHLISEGEIGLAHEKLMEIKKSPLSEEECQVYSKAEPEGSLTDESVYSTTVLLCTVSFFLNLTNSGLLTIYSETEKALREDVDYSAKQTSLVFIYSWAGMAVASVLAGVLVDCYNLPRKTWTTIGLFLQAFLISLVVVSPHSIHLLFAPILYISFVSMGLLTLLSAEIFDTKYRTSIISAFHLAKTIGILVSQYIYYELHYSVGHLSPYWLSTALVLSCSLTLSFIAWNK